MQEAVSQILIDRSREADGISRMVAVSVLAHAVMIAIVILAPTGWLSPMPETDVTPMMITLGGAPGPDAGGVRMLSGRTVQAVRADAKPRVEPPPAPKAPEMVAPSPTAKPAPRTPAKPRTPTTGAEVKTGSSRVDTGAAPVPFGGLSTGGGGGEGATTDFANFCCPAYLIQVTDLIKRNWQRNQGAAGTVQMKFVINRDGSITGIEVEKPSGQALLDQAAHRALVMTDRLPQLPREFTESRLTIHLIFDYQR